MDRSALLGAYSTIVAQRRDAMNQVDTARDALLASASVPASEEIPQGLAAILRQLDNAARELGDAIRSLDQVDRLRAKA